MSERILVNFWYAEALGHAIEALRYSLGLMAADGSRRISILLNDKTATDLVTLCPFVREVFAISCPFTGTGSDPAAALLGVPKHWDWVLDDPRRLDSKQLELFANMARYYEAADRHFEGQSRRGILGMSPPSYIPHQKLTFELPKKSHENALRLLPDRHPRIAVALAGGGPRYRYPSLTSWVLILQALLQRFPSAVFCFVGKRHSGGGSSASISPEEVRQLVTRVPESIIAFDAPLSDRLAVISQCELFLSPHTGLGTAALCVGTPWLTLSGNGWGEYFFNHVPFYSVLPAVRRFPCFQGLNPEPPPLAQDSDGEGPRTPSMSAARIAEDLEELLDAAEALITRRLPYEEAMRTHFGRLSTLLGSGYAGVWTLDNVHRSYAPIDAGV